MELCRRLRRAVLFEGKERAGGALETGLARGKVHNPPPGRQGHAAQHDGTVANDIVPNRSLQSCRRKMAGWKASMGVCGNAWTARFRPTGSAAS